MADTRSSAISAAEGLAALHELFSAECMALDDAWLAEVRATRQGWVPVDAVAAHLARLCRLSASPAALREWVAFSDQLAISDDGTQMRKKHPLRRIAFPDTVGRNIMVELLPPGATAASVRAMFDGLAPPGELAYVRVVCDPEAEEGVGAPPEGGGSGSTPPSTPSAPATTLARLAALCRRHPGTRPYALVQVTTYEAARPLAEAAAAAAAAAGTGVAVTYTEDRSRRRTPRVGTPCASPALGASDTPRGFALTPSAGPSGSGFGSSGEASSDVTGGGAHGRRGTFSLGAPPAGSPPQTSRSVGGGRGGAPRRVSADADGSCDTDRGVGAAATAALARVVGVPVASLLPPLAVVAAEGGGLLPLTPPLSRAGSGGIPGGRPSPATTAPASAVATARTPREDDAAAGGTTARWSALRGSGGGAGGALGGGSAPRGGAGLPPTSSRSGPVVPPLRGFAAATAAGSSNGGGGGAEGGGGTQAHGGSYFPSPRGGSGYGSSAASPTARGSTISSYSASGSGAGGGPLLLHPHTSPRQQQQQQQQQQHYPPQSPYQGPAAGAAPAPGGGGTTTYALPPGAIGYIFAAPQPPLPPGPPPAGPIPSSPSPGPPGAGSLRHPTYSPRVPGLAFPSAMLSGGSASGSGGSDAHGAPPGFVLVPASALQPPLPPGPPPPMPGYPPTSPEGYAQYGHQQQQQQQHYHHHHAHTPLQPAPPGLERSGSGGGEHPGSAYASPRLPPSGAGGGGGIASASAPLSARRWARAQPAPAGYPGGSPQFTGGGYYGSPPPPFPPGDADSPALDVRASPRLLPGGSPALGGVGGGGALLPLPVLPVTAVHDPSGDVRAARGPDVSGAVGFGRLRTPRGEGVGAVGSPRVSPRAAQLPGPPQLAGGSGGSPRAGGGGGGAGALPEPPFPARCGTAAVSAAAGGGWAGAAAAGSLDDSGATILPPGEAPLPAAAAMDVPTAAAITAAGAGVGALLQAVQAALGGAA